ncbi:MAG: asparaginase [Ramlibacter sp.]
MSARKIVVLGTGGTIAGTATAAHDNLGYTAAQVGVDALLATVPALDGVQLLAEQVAQVDSKDMDFAVWRDLALRCAHWLADPGVQGLVITHGTDTLEETAYFLQAVLAPAKPVVLTCAMRPATALAPDGPQNLADAVALAATSGARGVLAVCAGVVHGALEVAKSHTYRLDAFSSGEGGPLGWIEEGVLRLARNWPDVQMGRAQSAMKNIASGRAWPRVEIVMNYAGADGAAVQALQARGVDGIVVAGTGNGTLGVALQDALLQAVRDGVRVVRSTRCATGRVLPHGGDVLPDSNGLSPVKARVALLLELLA